MSTNRYMISADLEGITGVASTAFAEPEGKQYAVACKYMTHDVNAVVRGILEADPEADIIVRDAHFHATNLDLHTLHPKARLVQGWGHGIDMVFPLLPDLAGVFLVGYHAGGHNNRAVLAHTYNVLIRHLKVNGTVLNEAGIAGLVTGHHDIPIAFISGDDHAVSEGKELFPSIVGVAVKESFARDCILSVPLEEAGRRLQEGAKEATEKLFVGQAKPLRFDAPLKGEVAFYNKGFGKSMFAHLATIIGFDERFEIDEEGLAIRFEAPTAERFMQTFILLVYVAGGCT